jgi:hypothetical protein
MSWKHWAAILIVIGAGILLQIPRHGDDSMNEHAHDAGTAEVTRPAPSNQDVAGPYRTVDLEVTGMT